MLLHPEACQVSSAAVVAAADFQQVLQVAKQAEAEHALCWPLVAKRLHLAESIQVHEQ